MKVNWDLLGASASLICAIHCVAVPLAFSFMAGSAQHFDNLWLEAIIFTVGVGVAGIALYNGFRKHRNIYPMISMIVGFAALFFGHNPEHNYLWMVLTGAILVMSAHYVNWRLQHQHA